jgi:pimeloyl-ACP methyl ester carboxylesterase
MPVVALDGIKTNYVKVGSGPYLLMMAPRGFDSTLQSWEMGKWKEMNALKALSEHFTVVAYDRRESGQSGGRIEPLTWKVYAQHAKLLTEHLGIEKTWLMGPCMGVALATQFAVLYPESCIALILPQPVGGFRWMSKMRGFFDRHIAFVRANGLQAVTARATGKNFMEDPEAGPWATVMASDGSIAARFVRQDPDDYLQLVAASRDAMFPDTFASGPSPKELMSIETPASIWPGDDASHSTSAAHQLRELMPRVDFWDVHPSTWNALNMLERIVAFKRLVDTAGLPRRPD